jgi:quercetin dioxygenase-like cupin family protein
MATDRKTLTEAGAPAKRLPCTATVLVDDDRVRVTRFDFAPGAETGWHRHGHDYVITAITDCPMLLEEPGGGTRQVLVPAGTAYRRSEGVEHNVVNNGVTVMSFVEVELKEPTAGAKSAVSPP